MTETVAAHAVTKYYGSEDARVTALDAIDVTFAHEFSAIMGPSGSGKSTLLHCLAGLDRVSSGKIIFEDSDIAQASDKELTRLRRDAFGFIFQSFNLIPTLNARENIELPIRLAGRKPDSAWVDRVIATTELADRLDHKPSELSGGQQQRVAAARAFASRPAVVFADEPTGNLDSTSSRKLLDFMRVAVDELGLAVVMVTHDPRAASRADRVVFLTDGKVTDDQRGLNAEQINSRFLTASS